MLIINALCVLNPLRPHCCYSVCPPAGQRIC